jgi:hypothetical protein
MLETFWKNFIKFGPVVSEKKSFEKYMNCTDALMDNGPIVITKAHLEQFVLG